MATATVELLAPVEDVWAFISEPYNFADWWPGVNGVKPDRRGFATGARWTLVQDRPGLFRKPNAPRMLLVREVEPYRLFAFHLVAERTDVELLLKPLGHDHTGALLETHGPGQWSLGRRPIADRALERLHDLIQTAEPAAN